MNKFILGLLILDFVSVKFGEVFCVKSEYTPMKKLSEMYLKVEGKF